MTNQSRNNKRILFGVLTVAVVMIGVSFAAVPLYTLFCRVTGYGGTTQTSNALPDAISDRTLVVSFNGRVQNNMPWDFKPEQRSITVRIGQKGLANYTATNRANTPTVGTALYNVTPEKAGQYFHKIACFCFAEQVLTPGQTVNMPVTFFIHPDILADPNMDDVTNITLSYIFFKPESDAYTKALETFYQKPIEAITPMVGPANK